MLIEIKKMYIYIWKHVGLTNNVILCQTLAFSLWHLNSYNNNNNDDDGDDDDNDDDNDDEDDEDDNDDDDDNNS